MKTTIIVCLIAAIFSLRSEAQPSLYFQEKENLVTSFGADPQRPGVGSASQYLSFYGNHLILRTTRWTYGPYALLGLSRASGHSAFGDQGWEVGLGGLLQYNDWNFLPTHQLYVVVNAGMKFGNFAGSSFPAGTGMLNLDLVKKYKNGIFPRSQLIISGQSVLSAAPESYSQALPAAGLPWGRSGYQVLAKQTISNLHVKDLRSLGLKVIALYGSWPEATTRGAGGEISLFRSNRDDSLIFDVIYIWPEPYRRGSLSYQMVVNFSAL